MDTTSKTKSKFNLQRSTFRDPAWILRNTAKYIQSIAPWEVNICEASVTSDTEVEVLCTYSWSHQGSKDNPVIYVPGFPKKWALPQLPVQLRPSGDNFIDAHAYSRHTQQFEPAFQALMLMNSDARFTDVDIRTNRNNLLTLLGFVSCERSDQFGLNLHIVGKTLILGRKDKIEAYRTSPLGPAFEERFTTALNGMANTYYRVVRYRFGNLNMVVRHETDAFCETPDTVFEELFRGIDIPGDSQAKIQIPILHESATAVFARGTLIPQRQVAELKTSRRAKTISQCWIGRTPNLCISKHEKGLVTEAEMKNVWGECVQWETDQQRNLRRLAGLLKQIQVVMGSVQSGRGVLVRKERQAPLQIFEGKPGVDDGLPIQITTQFWQCDGGDTNRIG